MPDPPIAEPEAQVPESDVQNRLLLALPEEERQRLLSHLQRVQAEIKYSFYEPDQPITHVYFPLSGVASLLMRDETGEAVEVSTVGNEGMVGLPVFLGARSTPGVAFMQVPGPVSRMTVETFRQEVTSSTRLHALLHRYVQAMMVQMAQGAACNRLHSIEQRAARWLLMTRDRVTTDSFSLTQEFLAQMLGVRRAGVSEVARQLQNDGLITYSRGIITILDRAGLEARACQCYWIIRREFERMLGDA